LAKTLTHSLLQIIAVYYPNGTTFNVHAMMQLYSGYWLLG